MGSLFSCRRGARAQSAREPPGSNQDLFSIQSVLGDFGQAAISLSREPALTSDALISVLEIHVIHPRLPTQDQIHGRIAELFEAYLASAGPTQSPNGTTPFVERVAMEPFDSVAFQTLGLGPQEFSICLTAFHPRHHVIRLQCTHIFHDGCLHEWLKRASTCPLCRSSCHA